MKSPSGTLNAHGAWPISRVFPLAIAVFLLSTICLALLSGCAQDQQVDARGSIVSSDGVVLAESQNVSNGKGVRAYPQGSLASSVVGSCYTQGAADGIEQQYAEALLAGEDVQLTIDMNAQKAAVEALGDHVGAIVVMDPATGAILALASTPAYDPSAKSVDESAAANHATELHIPGSTFKTVTLAAALQNGVYTTQDQMTIPMELRFDEGVVTNYQGFEGGPQGVVTVEQAFAKSINTVFASIALVVGPDKVIEQARAFGFDTELMNDIPLETSTILVDDSTSTLSKAWMGVGQAVNQPDGSLHGPLMTVVQGATIASCVANDGVLRKPYLVAKSDDALASSGGSPDDNRPISQETARQIAECMRSVVTSGTGKSAAVKGVDVRGKTGTAETGQGYDDGWFIGFAQKGDQIYAISVLVEKCESTEACAVAAKTIRSLFA